MKNRERALRSDENPNICFTPSEPLHDNQETVPASALI
jgi:hypothetical protein